MVVVSTDRAQNVKHNWKEEINATNSNSCSVSDRTKMCSIEPKFRAAADDKKVAVVYYLSRNGHLEHPHFMEVSLNSIHGLYLRDVINRLNVLRGRAMVKMYSWSSKRSYKNGYVWHDLSENDFIHPVNGSEYVLKGTEILHFQHNASTPTSSTSSDTATTKLETMSKTSRDESASPVLKQRMKSWSSFDINDCRQTALVSTDASTQTEDTLRKLRNRATLIENDDERAETPQPEAENITTELSRDEISPPPSSSSPETLETLIKADYRRMRALRIDAVDHHNHHRSNDNAVNVSMCSSGRMKASAVLMHLFSCGSISVKDHGMSLVSQYKTRLPRASNKHGDGCDDEVVEIPSRLNDKEYFSGSLVETKKMMMLVNDETELSGLKRSSSFNAERDLKLNLSNEVEGLRVRCVPRKLKSSHGSKRINYEPT